MQSVPKIFIALFIQFLVFALIAAGVYFAPLLVNPPYPYWLLVLLQGSFSAILISFFGLPKWWRYIQFFLPLGLYGGIVLGFDPVWALIIFVFVWLVFSNAFKERVPLYLTNSITRDALKVLVKKRHDVHFLDLGCGLGGNVALMSQIKNVSESHGVETAPVPYLLSKLVTFFRGGETYAMDLWKADLSYYDVVYAFLSPEPMPKLWKKIMEEMLPGSVFVSNSFSVPGVEPTEVWELSDRRETKLYIYYIN